jgi:conjugative transfer signal peptidase TraF
MCAQLVEKCNSSRSASINPSCYHKVLSQLTLLVLTTFSCLFLSDWLGLRFNHSQSVAPGVYWVVDKPPEKGDFVSFCPAQDSITQMAYERGYIGFGNCPGHYERLLKRVVGVTGDAVTILDHGVTINQTLQPDSTALPFDGIGRPLKSYSKNRLILKPNELWVMSNRSPLSFDSRYFGPIHQNQVSDVVRPLLTWQ